MFRVLKWIGFLLVAGIIALFGFYFYSNEDLPVGSDPERADLLANKVLDAIDNDAWLNTNYIQWTFRGEHHFLWDKRRNFCEVKWENKKVLINLANQKGIAFVDGKEADSDLSASLVEEAWGYFCNDSFWLNAPAKIFDDGTKRSIVKLNDGSEGLLVQYTSGGVTPNDSYLWILDENYLPKAYKMWVQIIPVGGLEFSWENYTALNSGAKIAQLHKSKILNIDITNLKDGQEYQVFGLSEDLFARL